MYFDEQLAQKHGFCANLKYLCFLYILKYLCFLELQADPALQFAVEL